MTAAWIDRVLSEHPEVALDSAADRERLARHLLVALGEKLDEYNVAVADVMWHLMRELAHGEDPKRRADKAARIADVATEVVHMVLVGQPEPIARAATQPNMPAMGVTP